MSIVDARSVGELLLDLGKALTAEALLAGEEFVRSLTDDPDEEEERLRQIAACR